jgi:hypothetical protein
MAEWAALANRRWKPTRAEALRVTPLTHANQTCNGQVRPAASGAAAEKRFGPCTGSRCRRADDRYVRCTSNSMECAAPKIVNGIWQVRRGAICRRAMSLLRHATIASFAGDGRTVRETQKMPLRTRRSSNPWHAARLVREHRLMTPHSWSLSFISHGSRLQFGALNHGRHAAINRSRYV